MLGIGWCMKESIWVVSPHLVPLRWFGIVFLEKVVQRCFEQGGSLQQVVLGVLAVQRRKRISGSLLAGTWQAIRGWKAIAPSRPRTPITRHLLEALVLAALSKGYLEHGSARQRWWSAALGFWLGFECLLRPGEVLGLRVCDVVVPEETLAGPDAGIVLVLQTPKTRRVWRKQFVISHESEFNSWLIWWLAGRTAKQRVFTLSMSSWRNMLMQLCHEMRVTNMRITLGSLRAGGATWQFREYSNLGRLQFLWPLENPSFFGTLSPWSYGLFLPQQESQRKQWR